MLVYDLLEGDAYETAVKNLRQRILKAMEVADVLITAGWEMDWGSDYNFLFHHPDVADYKQADQIVRELGLESAPLSFDTFNDWYDDLLDDLDADDEEDGKS